MEKYPWATRHSRGSNSDKLVDYIVLAEFDIDTGSTVRHQYPEAIPDYKADWFAEHMIPEGCHNRVADYTYICLNRSGVHLETDFWANPELKNATKQTMGSDMPKSADNRQVEKNAPSTTSSPIPSGKHFLYGINLVKTKHDSKVRRGAIVKALCIFSRYHCIESFKEPLDIALEKYFEERSVNVLESLFKAMNNIDLSNLPRPNFLEQCLMRRGVSFESARSGNHNSESDVSHHPESWVASVPCLLFDREVHLAIPLHRTPDEVGDINVTRLVQVFGESTIRIFNAVMKHQRILFIGYNHSAADVAQLVLSTVALVAPPMTGVIQRTYPYANLTDLEFLQVNGYIAGVTNPMFGQHGEWWDLCCVLDLPNNVGYVYTPEEKKAEDAMGLASGVHIAPRLNLSSIQSQMDNKFIIGVMSGIDHYLDEYWVRQQFFDHCSVILEHTHDLGVLLSMSHMDRHSKQFVEAYMQFMGTVRQTSTFRQLIPHYWAWCDPASSSAISSPSAVLFADASTTPAAKSSSGVLANKEKTEKQQVQLEFTSSTPTVDNKNKCDDIDGSHGTDKGKSAKDSNVFTIEKGESNVPVAVPSLLSPPPGGASFDSASTPRKMLRGVGLDGAYSTEGDKLNPYGAMYIYCRKLSYQMHLHPTKDVQVIFEYLLANLDTEASVQAFILNFPEARHGLTAVGMGVFHDNAIVRWCALQVLLRVQRFQSTCGAFVNLNQFIVQGYKRQLRKLQDGSLEAAVKAEREQQLRQELHSKRRHGVRNLKSSAAQAAAYALMEGPSEDQGGSSSGSSKSSSDDENEKGASQLGGGDGFGLLEYAMGAAEEPAAAIGSAFTSLMSSIGDALMLEEEEAAEGDITSNAAASPSSTGTRTRKERSASSSSLKGAKGSRSRGASTDDMQQGMAGGDSSKNTAAKTAGGDEFEEEGGDSENDRESIDSGFAADADYRENFSNSIDALDRL